MLRPLWFVLLAILAFLAVLVVRLPARWISAALPADALCNAATGTLWNGECASLTLKGRSLGRFGWQLQSLSILHLAATAIIVIDGPALRARTTADLARGGALTLHDLQLNLQLPASWVPRLPPDLSGQLNANLALLRVSDGWVRELRGRIDAQKLISGGPQPAPLGSYELDFDGVHQDGKLVGRLRDLGGPLDVIGSLTLNATPGYLLEGTVAARADANAELQRQLSMLGAPDAAGRRRFAQEAQL